MICCIMDPKRLVSRLRAFPRRARRAIALVWGVVWRLTALVLLLAALGDGVIRDESLRGRTIALARDDLFDFAVWEFDALWLKARQEILGIQPYLDTSAGKAQVITYMAALSDLVALEDRIEGAYADPAISDPAAATAGLRARRDALRRRLAADQPLVESIIEEQVSAVLVDEGFGTLGQVLPPVAMHFSALPMVLVISPRDRIEFAVSLELVPLTIEQRAALEARIDSALEVSSLVEQLGGLSLYPSMIEETPSLARAFEVTAHEWAHHYLLFFPLGLEYNALPETRIINETVATFFGEAVAVKVLERYYPEVTPPDYGSFLAPPASSVPDAPHDPDAPPPFDFGRELNNTRAQVDFMLWHGNVAGAETYMEYQRRAFVRHGHPIRKLNQAYFAFHGGYQGAPGAGGTDPTGPALADLLALSPDLQHFLATVRGITTRDKLLAARDAARAKP
jgi:hypothetical protein